MKIALALLSLVFTIGAFSQTPGIKWQKTMGGTSDDVAFFSFRTNDNGFVTAGITYSNNGDVSGNHGNADIWITKMNFQGQVQWDRVIGGSLKETPVAYYYNTDGTMLILGTTASNDGDVSGNHGNTDVWVSKLASDGSSVWHKCFGGSNSDSAYNIIKAANGSYVISASTLSNNGDVTVNQGGRDLWVFDIDEAGTLQWQTSLGGSSTEVVSRVKTIQSTDGSYYTITETTSNDGDVTGYTGGIDMWLVKLSNTGVLQWQKCLGGSSKEIGVDLKEGQNGEMYICGTTNSPGLPSFHFTNTDYSDIYLCRISSAGVLLSHKCYGEMIDDVPCQIVSTFPDGSCVINSTVNSGGGDVAGYHGSFSGGDIWLFKVANDLTIEWQRALGGTSDDRILNGSFDAYGSSGGVIITADLGYLVTGYTTSLNGDATGYHFTLDSADADIWVMKLNPTGILEWQKTLGGFRGDLARGTALEIVPGDYIITGYTNSSNGDIQTLHGGLDEWIMRLGPVNIVKGILYYDQNKNGVKDAGEPLSSDAIVKTEKTNDVRNAIPAGGLFINETDTGTYTTTVQLPLPYYTVVPSSHQSSFTTYFNTDSFSFALQPIAGMRDLVINVIPLGIARPGFPVSYKILYKNAGTDTVGSGEILFAKDSRLDFVSSVPAVSSTNGDTLKWTYSNLKPLDTASITLNMTVQSPPAVVLGDTLISVGIITPVAGDQTPGDDTSEVKQIVRAAVDPNDKYENNEGKISPEYITSGKYLNYLVRFQNVGNDTAFNIVIRDTLSTKLNLATLQVTASSHSYSVSVSGNVLIWTFNNIRLPYSSIDEPGSHGFIAYRIKPNSNLIAGDIIENSASIYFDFNLPVKTNNAVTEIAGNIALPLTLINFNVVYHNEQATLHWSTQNERNVRNFEIERGFNGRDFTFIGAKNATGNINTGTAGYEWIDNLAAISAGTIFYRLKMIDIDGKTSYSKVVLVRKNSQSADKITLLPNPVANYAQMQITSATSSDIEIRVINASGKRVLFQRSKVYEGNNSIVLNDVSKLLNGLYMLQMVRGDKMQAVKFIIAR